MMQFILAAIQASAPTVGDTIWVENTARLPAGYIARQAEWDLEGDVELLGEPVISVDGATVTIKYPVVAWKPGTHTVQVPGLELIGPDGAVEPTSGRVLTIEVASILPDEPHEEIAIRDQAGIVGRPVVSLIPLAVLLLFSAFLLSILWWWWLRKSKARTRPQEIEHILDPPIERWAEAGEHRAVLAAASDSVRQAISRVLPEPVAVPDTAAWVEAVRNCESADWDRAEVIALLRDIDLARFKPEGPEAVVELYHRARSLTPEEEESAVA